MKQSSNRAVVLPAWLALFAAVWVPHAAAQDRYRLTRAENFRQEPSARGRLLAQVNPGAELESGTRQGRWIEVTLEGWIWAQSVRPDTRSGFDLAVARAGGENLRLAPNGDVSARLLTGFLLQELERRPNWVHVRRTGWMWAGSLAPVAAVDTASRRAPEPAAGLDHARAAGRTGILVTAGADTLGSLDPGAPVRVITRSGDWARVRIEGWVRTADLESGAEGVLSGVTGAEVRSRPADFEGQLLEWTVQYVSVQTADELRRNIPANRRYMLARGPVPEHGFVYIVLAEDQVADVERLAPLTEITVLGRVRAGRSQYLGNPILDLIDFAVTEPL